MEAGAEPDAPTALLPPPWPGLRTAVQELGFEEHLPTLSLQPAGAQCGLEMEMGMGWQGKPCPVLQDPNVHRQGLSLCVHSPLQHWQACCPKYTFPFLPLLSQCPLCLCLVSGCLDPPGLLVHVSQCQVSSGARGLPLLCPGQMDELEMPVCYWLISGCGCPLEQSSWLLPPAPLLFTLWGGLGD